MHHHDHSHTHNHAHIPQNRRILAQSFAIISIYMLIEFLGGWYFHSLALMADAGHMVNDSLSLLLAWLALFVSAYTQKWFALINGASLILVAVMILWEALERFWSPTVQTMAIPMLIIALIGLLVNIFVAQLMIKGDHNNLNMKAAYLHVLADLLGSVVAIIAGVAIWLWQWQWVDTLASILLSLLVLKNAYALTQQAWQNLRAHHAKITQ